MARYLTFRFQPQTNSTLLGNLPDSVLANLSNALLSIDGGEAISVYRQVVNHTQAMHNRMVGHLHGSRRV